MKKALLAYLTFILLVGCGKGMKLDSPQDPVDAADAVEAVSIEGSITRVFNNLFWQTAYADENISQFKSDFISDAISEDPRIFAKNLVSNINELIDNKDLILRLKTSIAINPLEHGFILLIVTDEDNIFRDLNIFPVSKNGTFKITSRHIKIGRRLSFVATHYPEHLDMKLRKGTFVYEGQEAKLNFNIDLESTLRASPDISNDDLQAITKTDISKTEKAVVSFLKTLITDPKQQEEINRSVYKFIVNENPKVWDYIINSAYKLNHGASLQDLVGDNDYRYALEILSKYLSSSVLQELLNNSSIPDDSKDTLYAANEFEIFSAKIVEYYNSLKNPKEDIEIQKGLDYLNSQDPSFGQIFIDVATKVSQGGDLNYYINPKNYDYIYKAFYLMFDFYTNNNDQEDKDGKDEESEINKYEQIELFFDYMIKKKMDGTIKQDQNFQAFELYLSEIDPDHFNKVWTIISNFNDGRELEEMQDKESLSLLQDVQTFLDGHEMIVNKK